MKTRLARKYRRRLTFILIVIGVLALLIGIRNCSTTREVQRVEKEILPTTDLALKLELPAKGKVEFVVDLGISVNKSATLHGHDDDDDKNNNSTDLDEALIRELYDKPLKAETPLRLTKTSASSELQTPVAVRADTVNLDTVNLDAISEDSVKTELVEIGAIKLNTVKLDTNKLNTIKQRHWTKKINYFVSVTQETRDISINRVPDNKELDLETLMGNYTGTLFSFTAGGNLFKRTSIHFDFTVNSFSLQGDIDGVESEFVQFQRNKSLGELFVEYDLHRGLTLGFDAYYGADEYRDQGEDEKFKDQEYGGGLLLSRKFKLGPLHNRLDYIYSYRTINIGSIEDGKSSLSFHNVLVAQRWPLTYELALGIDARFSYYPKADRSRYWESSIISSFGLGLDYRIKDKNELFLRLERMSFSDNGFGTGPDSGYVNRLSIRLEHRLGSKQSKRRRRRNKAPHLLIK